MNKPIYAVTLADLRKAGACFTGYNKVVRMLQGEPFSEGDAERESYIKFSHDEPVSLVAIAKNNGLDDALWTLRCVPGCDRDARLFAVWAARQVEYLMTDPRSKDAMIIAEQFANGATTKEELDAAAAAAARAAARAADAAAWAAADTARAAAWAAWAAVWDAARADAAAARAADAAAWAADAAARAAVWDAARAAADTARAADAAARADAAAARAAQNSMFIDMCEGRAPWQV